MPRPKGPAVYFPHVKKARQALAERAQEILESYLKVIEEARAAGDFDVASKSLQWLIEHMPDSEGEGVVSPSVDKPKQQQLGTGPTIQLGFILGGVGEQKALPEASPVIEAEKVENES